MRRGKVVEVYVEFDIMVNPFKFGISGGLKIKIVGADVLDGPISTR
jgi:hypothetical protein